MLTICIRASGNYKRVTQTSFLLFYLSVSLMKPVVSLLKFKKLNNMSAIFVGWLSFLDFFGDD